MRRYLLGFLLLTSSALAAPNDAGMAAVITMDHLLPPSCHGVENWSRPGACNIAVGLGAVIDLNTNAAGNILVGDDTRLPSPDAVGFVNVGNAFCGWRGDAPDQFRQVACPAVSGGK